MRIKTGKYFFLGKLNKFSLIDINPCAAHFLPSGKVLRVTFSYQIEVTDRGALT